MDVAVTVVQPVHDTLSTLIVFEEPLEIARLTLPAFANAAPDRKSADAKIRDFREVFIIEPFF
jgi:hypothetical protein